MEAVFIPKRNVDTTIVAEAPGHIFAAGTDPWLGQAGALDYLQICSLSPGQVNRWITGQGFDEMISLTDIIPD